MGNFIKTRNGTEISLDIPAQITSFEELKDGSSHITKGKLKVFFIGSTGDIRVFSKEFSESLLKTLPGTPVVAHYDDESEDFIGHDNIQYVYGYVPEDAVPEFIEEDNKTWAVVDVNLFTERNDKIGEVANKIIGKAQSLELNPDSVDYEMVYVNKKLQKIVFKKGAFYGLSVLGDDQSPAFEGAHFFTKDVIKEFKDFNTIKSSNINFTSLGYREKLEHLNTLINKSNCFDYCYVVDFTEEQVIVAAWENGEMVKYAAQYKWNGIDNYQLGEFKKVMVTYTETENLNTSNLSKEENLDATNLDASTDNSVNYKKEEEDKKPCDNPQCGDTGNCKDCKDCEDDKGNKEEKEKDCDCGCKGGKETKAECKDKKENCTTLENEDSSINKRETEEVNEESSKAEFKEEEKETVVSKENSATEFAALSSEERDELIALRNEKKQTLINSFKEYLNNEIISDFESKINEFDYNSLEKELKVASFDSNKNRMNNNEGTTINTILPKPTFSESRVDKLDRLVSENI